MSDDKILVECPECGQQYRVPASAAGKTAKCQNCEALMPIPGGVSEAPAPAEPPAQQTPPPPAVSAGGLPPEMAANRAVAGRTCPICNNTIDFGQMVRNCELCSQTHHMDCWQSHGGCGTPSCANAPLPKMPLEGETTDARPAAAGGPQRPTKPCPFCGEDIPVKAVKCRHCNEFLPGQGTRRRGPVGTCSNARTSLILGIVSFFCCGIITGPIAIVLGVKARREIADSQGRLTGDGMAIAGIVLGIIATVFNVLYFVMALARS